MPVSVHKMLTLGEIVRFAANRADPSAWDYLIGGSETESSLRRNRRALDKLGFRPRVLRDVSQIDSSTKILGIKSRLPLFLAPLGSIDQLDISGAIAPALAAKEFGVASFVSSVCPPGMENTMTNAGGNLLFQLYVRGNVEWVIERVHQATTLGYKAFCLTVDSAMYGRRERDKLRGFTPRSRSTLRGANFQASLDWKIVEKIKSQSKLPLILKGISTKEDALIALDHGVDVVYVSNHGGRQLDCSQGSMEVLPEILAVVKDRAKVFVDGSINRGTDILKAICLGADAVGIGRMCGYGLAAAGKSGVIRVLELLEEEVINAMANLGATKLDELGPGFLQPVDPVHEPSVFSAFHPVKIPHS